VGRPVKLRLPKYVNAFHVRGRRYYYFRRPGAEAIRLPALGTPEFEVAYQAALHGGEIGSSRTIPGTVNEAVVAYYKSLAYRELAQGSRYMFRSYLERFREKYGDSRLATMPPEFIVQMMDRMAPFAARNWLKSMRALMQHAASIGLCKTDPTRGVKLPKIKSDGIHAWSESEIEQFEAHHSIGTGARLAFALALYTGQRRSDLVRMGRQHVRNGEIEVRQKKAGAGVPPLIIPIDPKLQEIIDATPGEHLTFLVRSSGRPYRAVDLSIHFRAWCDEAGLPENCSVHGLRKAAARRLAERGCSAHEIAAITGHRTLKEVERYTRSAEQAKLARRAIPRTDREPKSTNS
jgi:integrase